ncbi:MAG: hypothetical protein IAF02_20080 [Anaerolineae bacterium]|nr:hypothetical protein [Anaerolineae bacterium]
MIRPNLGRKWSRVAEVATIPATATNDSDRQPFIPALRCGHTYPLDSADCERAGMGTIARGYVVYTEPAEGIKSNMRLILNHDYRIHSVTGWPDDDMPDFMEIVLEREAQP